MFELSDRDYGLLLLDHIDLEAQLLAVRNLLSRNRVADEALTNEIKALEIHAQAAKGQDGIHLADAWVDELHGSVYQSAANSMATAGMLAPLLESLFTALFARLGRQQTTKALNTDAPDRRTSLEAEYWDPHVVFGPKGRRTDLAAGIVQLATASGLEEHLPAGYGTLLKALFAYRNKMFHHGFEWPPSERSAFAAMIKNEGWPPQWFDRATSAGEPWVFYMSDTMIDLCLATVDKVLAGAGKFARGL